ncbi:ferredoxin reductase [Nocardia terpenica]|uniref:Ferredoxin reductase n=2 Tax=Nocardia terpenica TaxID=455432 RepID=A0A6G9ZFT5_9NOCA|nr:ferredoxin reductase [Nocardia terpenica]
MRAEITAVCRSAPGSVTLTLRPTWQWRGHRAGQFVRIGVIVNGVKHTRCYSPVNPQSQSRHLELTVKTHPQGVVSPYLYHRAVPGMVVDLAPAAGSFLLPEHRPDAIVLISGGSGITPVLSMLGTLADESYSGRLAFLHYARTPGQVPHRDRLESIAHRHNSFHIELRYPRRARDAGPGYFDYKTLQRVAPWFARAQTYVCGPAALRESVQRIYAAEGIENRLHTEAFTLTATPVNPAEVTGAAMFSASGVRSDNTGASLLEQAEAAGLTPEFGCRMGICFSCTAVKRSGCTRDLRTGELDNDPDQPIQLCINAAVGDVDIEI